MAQKTSVDGNRVMIDDEFYNVKPAGTDRYAVYDGFGGALGYFKVNGKSITTDDYGIAGAPSLMLIGRLWRAGNAAELDGPAPQSKMVCEVLTLAAFGADDVEKARAHLLWLKKQPGLKTAFYAHDGAGKAVAVRVWSSRARMEGHKEATPPDGAEELPVSSTDVLGLVDDI
jgi:hypothetical protein